MTSNERRSKNNLYFVFERTRGRLFHVCTLNLIQIYAFIDMKKRHICSIKTKVNIPQAQIDNHSRLWLSCCYPLVILLLSCCYPVVILLLSSCFPVVILLLSSCFPVVILLLSCCYPVVILLFSFCYPVVILLVSSCFPVVILL